mmetsp:Transcript_135773/g.378356  ORF Transcript_135773/g.378356 Transcript_135773/m.378356 type:complete len:502 (-) Transcript_135773:124-1629(-)
MADATDAAKRKAPEESTEAGAKHEEPPAKKAESDAKAEPTAAAPAATPAAASAAASAAAPAEKAREKPAADEPEAKRLKPTPPDLKAVRKQVEYYLSDENLRYDKFFNEKITAEKDGWLDMQLVLSCNKMKSIRATKEDVVEALKESKIEVREGGSAVRRPGNAPVPKLETRPQHVKKSSLHAHDGGVIAALQNIPAEQNWTQVKEKLKEKLPQKVSIWFVSEVSEKNQCIVAVSPFDDDQKFFEELVLEVGGAKLKGEVCQGEALQQALKMIPKHVRDKRERESRKRQKERNRPILVGTQRFVNVAALRGRVKEILNARSDGEQLKTDGSDFKLIKALLAWHPRGEEKSKGLIGMKVQKSEYGDSRCFFMIKEGGVEEDFSAKKCLDAIEQNPPYVQNEPKKEAKGEAKAEGKVEAKGDAKAEGKEKKDGGGEEKPAEEKGGKDKKEEVPAEKKDEKPAKENDGEKPAEVRPAEEKPAEENKEAAGEEKKEEKPGEAKTE